YTLVVSPTSNAIQTVKDEPIRTSVKATKQWVGPIGSAVTVHLYADDVDTGKTVTLNAANNWEDTFTNLRKYKPGTTTEIKYTVKEDAVANYNGVVSGDMATGFTITNTNTEKTTVKVTKAWVGTPAASVTIKLYADGAEKETVTLTATDNWTHTFSNLPKYDENDGHEIV
ncbi:MAG: Cna B-type domain-containing protein, partial [Solobacterium sp.]|nr:Cna B-type domain-containing protein [Solobacterium sp.]